MCKTYVSEGQKVNINHAFNLGFGSISPVSLLLSIKYSIKKIIRNTPAINIAIFHGQKASRVGTIKNALMTATSWHDKILV